MNQQLALARHGLNYLKKLSTRRSSLYLKQSRSISSKTKGENGDEYTHIIVGAGSAGCVLANRLSAEQSNNVLLLEAGPEGNSWKIKMPAATPLQLGNKTYNWFYHTVPQKQMGNREMYWPRGKVLGGSSAINAMIYTRGHAYDYDRWEREGAAGWSYADCLPYFKHSQCHELGGNDYRGANGPLHVSRGKVDNPLTEAFIRAGKEAGYPYTSDVNGYQQDGFGLYDVTIHKGVRWSTASAFLRTGNVQTRNNLTIHFRSLANRVVFEGTKAVGVEFTRNRVKTVARATRDVILSGGTVNSPQLLMLSGVGNADDLKQLDIPVVTHLPGVGQNLHDHLQVYIQYHCTRPVTLYNAQFPLNMISIGLEWFMFKRGLGASIHLDGGAFLRSRPEVNHPDIQLFFLPSMSNDHGQTPSPCHAFQVHVCTLRGTSRGSIKLKSCDPTKHPIIDPNYLAEEEDLRDFIKSVRLSREIISQKAFDQFRGEEIAPGSCVQTDAEIEAFVRSKAETIYHPCGTCKMGSQDDPMAVVDSTTRVFGVDNLRVVDASIMPSIVSGNTNAPTIMIAEKVSDILLVKKPLERITVPVWEPASLET